MNLFLRGRSEYYRYTPDHLANARRCFEQAIEIDPTYVDVICHRFLNLTGTSPVRESDGVAFADLAESEELAVG